MGHDIRVATGVALEPQAAFAWPWDATPVEQHQAAVASSSKAHEMTLLEMTEILRRELDLKKSGNMKDVITQAAQLLDVAADGPLWAVAKECMMKLGVTS
jgi:hypothetical protein